MPEVEEHMQLGLEDRTEHGFVLFSMWCVRSLNHKLHPQVRLASVRRSLFTNESERTKFLNHLVDGTRTVLRAQVRLAHHVCVSH